MNNEISIATTGWAALSKEKLKQTKKAMKEYRKIHPNCEITGSSKKCQVHHIVPIWSNPILADDPENMITLSTCANIHHIYGHDRNFRLKFNRNIKEISKKMLDLQQQFDTVHREMNKIQTNQNKTSSIIQWVKEKIIELWIRY
jgi:hypothetical protein